MEEWERHTGILRRIYASDEFMEFFKGLDEKVKGKFEQGFEIIQTVYVLNTKLVKKLVNTDL